MEINDHKTLNLHKINSIIRVHAVTIEYSMIIDHRQGQVVPGIGSEDYSQLGLRGNDVENNYQLLDEEEMGPKVKN